MDSPLFAPLRQPYYIFSPPYRHTSGGIRVLNLLCHALNLSGEEAYMLAESSAPELRAPMLSKEVLARHEAQGRRPVMLYPEVVDGNPYAAPVVARYLLNVPGFITGHHDFGPGEITVTYTKDILPEGWEALVLAVPTSDRSIFNNEDNPHDQRRSGACVYARKYFEAGLPLRPETEGATELSLRVPQRSLRDLADLLRRTEVLYAYEHSTLCYEALLCGCPVVYLPNPFMPHLYESMAGRDGVAWGTSPEELARAKATLRDVPAAFDRVERDFWEGLKAFVVRTQEAVAGKDAPPQAWQRFFGELHRAPHLNPSRLARQRQKWRRWSKGLRDSLVPRLRSKGSR